MRRRISVTAVAVLVFIVGSFSGPALAALTIQQMMDRMRAQSISGVTVITHGYSFWDDGGDYMMDVATSVRDRIRRDTGQTVWLVDYDIANDGQVGTFDESLGFLPAAGAQRQPGHVVFLFDWAAESNRESRWWAESAGDALFGMMTGMGMVTPRYQESPPLHMIAHSFGSGVTSEAIERMAAYKVPVSQMTLIDPHDFDQTGVPVDQDQRIFDLGKPAGYGATVWNNVEFADVYYQTRGHARGAATRRTDDPEGRPIPGAFNRLLDGTDELPAGNPYANGLTTYFSDHGFAYDSFYRGSVEGARPTTGTYGPYSPAHPTDYGQTGWAYSVHNPNRIARPQPNFYGNGQDHEHSSSTLQTDGSANEAGLAGLGITAQQVSNGRWAPDWTIDQIANGNFAAGDFQWTAGTDLMAGWTHHGGVGGFKREEPIQGGTNFYTRLFTRQAAADPLRRHNFQYVPLNATTLHFESRIWDGAVDETFRVLMRDTELGTINVTQTDQTWRAQSFAVPQALRNSVSTLTFELIDGRGGGFFGDDASIDIDSLRWGMAAPRLQTSVAPGSIIDLGRIQRGDIADIPRALSMANVGDDGSILDVFRVQNQNLLPTPVGQFHPYTFESPGLVLRAGREPEWLGISFDSRNDRRGTYRTDLVFLTTVGPQSFRLQVTVVPEPPGWLIVAIGSVLAAICGRRGMA